jgi:hypothetical protein
MPKFNIFYVVGSINAKYDNIGVVMEPTFSVLSAM